MFTSTLLNQTYSILTLSVPHTVMPFKVDCEIRTIKWCLSRLTQGKSNEFRVEADEALTSKSSCTLG